MKGGMLRKTIPLIVLTILLASLPIPVVRASTETLYVNAFNSVLAEWDETGASPWLSDSDANYISTSIDDEWHDEFLFPDHAVTGTLNSVYLYIEVNGPSARNDKVYIYLWGEAGAKKSIEWVLIAQLDSDDDAYTWYNYNVSAELHDWATVDGAKLKFQYQRSGSASTQTIYVRRAYLYVDYTEAGTQHEREVTQVVSWAGATERAWSTTRDVSQDVSLASDSERLWSTSRSVSTAIVLTSDSLRSWSLSRVVSQALSLTSDAFASLTQMIMRSVSLQVTLTSEATRSWSLLRDLSQSISLATNSGRLATFSRAVSQSMSLISNAFGTLITFIERTVSLSVTTSFNANRLWTMIRGVSQNILAQMSAGGLLTPGDPGDPPDTDRTPSVFNVVNEFNTSMIMMNVLTVLATGVYLSMGRDFAWGAVATFLWFVTALAMLANDPSNWILSRVYGVFGSIFVVLTIVSVVNRLNPEEDKYFDDWE